MITGNIPSDVEMTDEEKEDFGRALMTMITIIHERMGGSMVGTVGFGTVELGEVAIFHINIHDASLCMDDEEHTPMITNQGSGTLQ